MSMRIVLLALGLATTGCRAPPRGAAAPRATTTPASAAATSRPAVAPGTPLVVRPGATVWLDASDARPLQLPTALAAGGLAVRVIGQDGDRVEVETDSDTACTLQPLRELRLRLFVAHGDLHDGTPPCTAEPTSAPAIGAAPQATRIVKGGARIYWRDGGPAGTVARDYTFAAPPAVAGMRTCFPFALAPGDELTLCFASDTIAEVRPPAVAERPANMLGGGADFGTGGFGGLVGSDEAGMGTIGLGTRGGLGSAPRAATLRVRQGKAEVVGPLDKDIVRRIVRAHLNEIRFCYRKALERNAEARGKVTISFTIAADGDVVEALPTSSSIADDLLTGCMAERIIRWKFPKPKGGDDVKVTYPFTLEPE